MLAYMETYMLICLIKLTAFHGIVRMAIAMIVITTLNLIKFPGQQM